MIHKTFARKCSRAYCASEDQGCLSVKLFARNLTQNAKTYTQPDYQINKNYVKKIKFARAKTAGCERIRM